MIEDDLVPFVNSDASDSICKPIRDAVAGQIWFGSAPEMSPETRIQPPYIIVEGPVDSDITTFSDGVSARYPSCMRFQVFGQNMTQVNAIRKLIRDILAPIKFLTLPHTYVQCFIIQQTYVDNRRLQRGKQEKSPDSSEDPMAEGHVDFMIWSSHLG